MPYSAQHKQATRARIVESAHHLFNRRGFADVSIDEIMAEAGLTRGGFYNHFRAKEDLFVETLMAYAANRKADNEQSPGCSAESARTLIRRYISSTHLEDIDGHCPLMALPTDISHAGDEARAAYRAVLEAMVDYFEANLEPRDGLSSRQRALALSATCVGAMVLARTVDDRDLARDICSAGAEFACAAVGPGN
jgi:TetR/AcrR family transcriptional repressor of nem operon